MTAAYNLTACPDYLPFDKDLPKAAAPFWAGKERPPAIGTRVQVTFNGFGAGTVEAYFIEEGFLGVQVRVDAQPDWHIRQGGTNPIHVFGTEIKAL